MKKQILFLQGAGEGAYKVDAYLVDSLRSELRSEFEVVYPEMPDEGNPSYEKWKNKIRTELTKLGDDVIVVGHSVGASVLAKFVSEDLPKNIHSIFLIAAPFWGGEGWLYDGYQELELPKGDLNKLPKLLPIFLYHCRDDEVVPFDHLSLYSQVMSQAKVHEIKSGGHQLNQDLTVIAKDIKSL